jgi:NodT family efflux transporter outer membrane factor (OMF) lipoprotein
LDLWGVNRRRAEVAAAQLRQNQMSFYGTRVSLIGTIASTYFQLQDVTQQKVITEETMESRRQTLNILKLRKANGIISGLEVRQAEVSLAEVEAKLPRLDDTIAELENQLRLALGQMPGDVEVTPIAESHTLPDVIPAGLPSALLQRRPDIRAAEESLHAATAGIGVAKGALFPQLALTTEFGTETGAFADLLKRDARAWAVDFGLLQPLFHAGAKRAALSAAEEQAQQALFSFHKTVLVAMGEVSNALGNYHRACAVASVNRRLVSSSQEYLRLATLQYRNGVLGYIDVLDAQRQLFSAQLALSQAERDRRLAMTDLYKSLGGGWLDTEGNPDTSDNK